MNRTAMKQRGFTLMEVMVVVAIVGILASIAYPSYQDIVRQSRRTDALNALMDIMARQERFYTDNNAYTADLTKLGLTLNAASKYETQPGAYYLISAAYCTAGVSSCVTLTADGTGTGQSSDKAGGVSCATLTLNSAGVKGNAACWTK